VPLKAVLLDAFGTVIHAEPPWEELRAECLHAVHATWRGAHPMPREAFLLAYEDARAAQHAQVTEAYAEFDFAARFAETARECGVPASEARAWGPAAAETYHRYQERLIHAYDDPGPTLARLRELGYKTALVSNYAHGGVLHDALTRLGIRPGFDALIASGDVGYMKPHPSVYRAALDALGVAPSEAVMVGDSLANDVLGAKRVGLRAIWSPYPRVSPPPAAPQADAVLERLADLPALVTKL
jgi:putative hydrolase of the HAD superfamily